MRRLFEGGVNSRESFNRINTVYKIEVKVSTFYEVSLFSLLSFSNINSQKSGERTFIDPRGKKIT